MRSRKPIKKSRKISKPTLNIVGINSCPYFINAKKLSQKLTYKKM